MKYLYLLIIALLFTQTLSQLNNISQQKTISNLRSGVKSDIQTCYGVMFDAGSSSTKANVYQWDCRQSDLAPVIQTSETQQYKEKNGIATFYNNLDGLDAYFGDLFDQVNKSIPEEQRSYVPVMLFATAGMRLIPIEQQDVILEKIRDIFQKSGYQYQYDWVQVITGQNEGIFMWISLNYLLNNSDSDETIVSVDLGGASTQIAFIGENEISTANNALVNFPNQYEYDVYSVSYLGYGNDQARIAIINEYGTWNKDKTQVSTPCINDGFSGQLQSIDGIVIGTGNAQECLDQIKQYFKLNMCNYVQQEQGCGIEGVYQPKFNPNKKIYAVSGITNAAQVFDNLKNSAYKLQDMHDDFTTFCETSWEDLKKQYSDMDESYLSTDCFLGLYSFGLLNYGYNIDTDSLINSPDKINSVEPTWTLGGMFYQIAQIPCTDDSPLCQPAKNLIKKVNFKQQILNEVKF